MAGLVARLRPGATRQGQVDQRNTQPKTRPGRNSPRGQLPVAILADRESRQDHRRRRRQGQSGGGRNKQRRL